MGIEFDRLRLRSRDVRGPAALVAALNAVIENLDRRVAGQEDLSRSIAELQRELAAYGEDRINQTLSPILDEITAALNLGALLTTRSDSTVSVGLGARAVTIPEGKRALFAPAAWVTLAAEDDAAVAMIARVATYDPTTGALALDVLRVEGAGIFSGWTISAAPAPDLSHEARTDDPHGSAAQAVATIRAGADPAFDTLAKVAAILVTLAPADGVSAAIAAAVAGLLRFDAAQTLTPTERAQARANAGVVIGTDVAAQVGGANNDVMQRKGGVWVNRTILQLLADLGVEMGAWSPYLDANGAPPSISTTEQYGYYLLVRDFVFVIGGHAGTISGGTGNARLLRLPFIPSPATVSTMSVVLSGATFTGVPLATFASNSTAALGVQSTSGAGTSALAITAFSGAFVCRLSGFYRR